MGPRGGPGPTHQGRLRKGALPTSRPAALPPASRHPAGSPVFIKVSDSASSASCSASSILPTSKLHSSPSFLTSPRLPRQALCPMGSLKLHLVRSQAPSTKSIVVGRTSHPGLEDRQQRPMGRVPSRPLLLLLRLPGPLHASAGAGSSSLLGLEPVGAPRTQSLDCVVSLSEPLMPLVILLEVLTSAEMPATSM